MYIYNIYIYTYIYIYIHKNTNANTDKYGSLLLLLPLDVDLVFLDNKKCILNSMGLYLGRRLINAFSTGFSNMLYKIKQ